MEHKIQIILSQNHFSPYFRKYPPNKNKQPQTTQPFPSQNCWKFPKYIWNKLKLKYLTTNRSKIVKYQPRTLIFWIFKWVIYIFASWYHNINNFKNNFECFRRMNEPMNLVTKSLHCSVCNNMFDHIFGVPF